MSRYEGDNFILNQQVCRAGIKAFATYAKDSQRFRKTVTPSTSYLLSLEAGPANVQAGNLSSMSDALCKRAALAVKQLSMEAAKTQVWTDMSWRCASVARAVTEAFIGSRLAATLSDAKDGVLSGLAQAESKAIESVCELVGLCHLTVDSKADSRSSGFSRRWSQLQLTWWSTRS